RLSNHTVGVVGVAFTGRVHARPVAETEGAELAAVIDVAATHGKAIADKHGARHFPDIARAAAPGGIDAFVVALPDTMHQEATCRLLERGLPVLVEKPMAHTLAAAKAMAAGAEEGGRRLARDPILRF